MAARIFKIDRDRFGSNRLPMVLGFACMAAFIIVARAYGDPPNPADSDVPCGIRLVGTLEGTPDALGEFDIVVRDLAHNPVVGADVRIDFGACATDIRVSSQQTTGTVDCSSGHPIFHATTDVNGRVRLRIVGSANHLGVEDPGAGFKCATVYSNGDNLGTINVAAFDQNGAGGVNPADFSVWLTDSFRYPGIYVGRSDFNCSNSINPADLALLLQDSFGSGSASSAVDYCH